MLEIATEIRPGVARVMLAGELDFAFTQTLEDTLLGVEQTESECIVLDLTELRFLDVRGLHVILRAAKRAESSGTSLVLARAQPAVVRLLSVSGADQKLCLSDEDDELSIA